MKRPRFIEIPPEPRVTRFTAHDNTMAKLARGWDRKTAELLEAEQLRLIQTWNRD
jgi:hypothetical protein